MRAMNYVLPGFLAMFGAGVASAQVTMEQAIHTVQQSGYGQITEVELDDGLWELKAVDADGRRVKLYVDPASGQLLDPRTPPALDVAAVTAHLQGLGYSQIREVELDDGRYEVEAINPAGQPVDLKVHPHTGAILKEDLDD